MNLVKNLNDPRVSFIPHWVAVLDNNESVCQLDDEIVRTWPILLEYLKNNNLNIVEFYIKYVDHIEKPLPTNAEGYFYRDAAGILLGNSRSMNLFSIGHLENGKVYSQKWLKPELVLVDKDVRLLDEVRESTWIRTTPISIPIPENISIS